MAYIKNIGKIRDIYVVSGDRQPLPNSYKTVVEAVKNNYNTTGYYLLRPGQYAEIAENHFVYVSNGYGLIYEGKIGKTNIERDGD